MRLSSKYSSFLVVVNFSVFESNKVDAFICNSVINILLCACV